MPKTVRDWRKSGYQATRRSRPTYFMEKKQQKQKKEQCISGLHVKQVMKEIPFIPLTSVLSSPENKKMGSVNLGNHSVMQAYIPGIVNSVGQSIMLDTGANISVVHYSLACKLQLQIRRFDGNYSYSGISDSTLEAIGSTKVHIDFGKNATFEVELWVGDHGMDVGIILGMDFLVQTGAVLDLFHGSCKFPETESIPLMYQHMFMRSSNDSSTHQYRLGYVNKTQTAPPAVDSFDGVDLATLDQTHLEREVYIKEGADLTAEQLANQLALLPELDEVEELSPVDMDKADIGEPENTPGEIEKLRAILIEYSDSFISSGNALPPPARGVVCDIDVGDHPPVAQRARRVPPHLLEKLAELLRGLLRAKLIRFSTSPWASPIVIVMKKNKKDIRLCIDYRLVNSLTKLMVYSMPFIDDLLDNFEKTMWFVSMDNASGYWAISMTARARLISAFVCPLGHFEWLRMPQGLKNAPQLYQRIIDNALWGFVRRAQSNDVDVKLVGLDKEELKRLCDSEKDIERLPEIDTPFDQDVFNVGIAHELKTVPVIYRRSYIDDINFGAQSWDSLCSMLKLLLESFRYWGISISLPKSSFGKRKVEFLSHTISRDGLQAAPRHLDDILAMPFPRTKKGVQKFIGSLVYYHRFIENFATYAAVLYELTDVQLNSGERLDEAKKAFELLKQKLLEAPLLKHADRSRPFVILVYTNEWAYGTSICQEYDGLLMPVRFVSKVFKDAEMRYTAAEKEVLALLKTLEIGFQFLAGQQITVYTRYSTMKWLFTNKSLVGRSVQWATMLSPWDLVIIRDEKTPMGLQCLLAASLTPREYVDEVLESIKPMKAQSSTNVIFSPVPSLKRDTEGYVATFDGAVKVKQPAGAYSAIIWRLPQWDVVEAKYFYKEGLTVNESEYHGLIAVMTMARDLNLTKLIVCGDSRIVLGQMEETLRCHSSTLQVLLTEAQILSRSFDQISFVHVARRYNQPADLLAGRGMKEMTQGKVSTDADYDILKQLNTLPELLYRHDDNENTVESTSPAMFAISRRQSQTAVENLPIDGDSSAGLCVRDVASVQTERLSRIILAQDRDMELIILKKFLQGFVDGFSKKDMKRYAKLAELYVLANNGALYYRSPQPKTDSDDVLRLVIPGEMQNDILRAYHDELGAGAHQGVGKTYAKIRQLFYWRSLYSDVEKYVLSCPDCGSGRGLPKFQGKSPGNIVASRPFQVVSMDFAIPLPETYDGNKALLLFMCMFSGYVILVPMASTEAQDVAEAYLENVFKRFGGQEVLRHDRDPRFMSKVFKAFSRMMRHRQRATLAYRPQANGKQERSVQTVMNAIRMYVSDDAQRDWDQYVNRLELALNCSYNYQLHHSSFFLVHGWQARTMLDSTLPVYDSSAREYDAMKWRIRVSRYHEMAVRHAHEIQLQLREERAERHNARIDEITPERVRTEYFPGEFVWIYFNLVKPGLSKKLAHKWHGPYRILEKVNEFTYRVGLDNDSVRFFPLIHISRLKPVIERHLRPREVVNENEENALDLDEALLPEDSFEPDENEEEYEVENIVDHRLVRRTRYSRPETEYLVKWKGYDEQTWVNENDLNCGALLYEYHVKKQREARFAAAQTADEHEE